MAIRIPLIYNDAGTKHEQPMTYLQKCTVHTILACLIGCIELAGKSQLAKFFETKPLQNCYAMSWVRANSAQTWSGGGHSPRPVLLWLVWHCIVYENVRCHVYNLWWALCVCIHVHQTVHMCIPAPNVTMSYIHEVVHVLYVFCSVSM